MAKTGLRVKARTQAEVRGARLHPLPALRPPQGRLPQVRPVPDLPAGDGPPRRAARRHQELLVTHHPQHDRYRSPRDRGAKPRRERTETAMTMTDPIADMLTRLRNANQAYHDSVAMPYSKLKQGVAEILKQEGYITSFEVARTTRALVGKTLEIQLKYGRNRERSIAGVRRISKPGLRVYAKSHRPAQGARRPRRRDHLDQPGPAHRPSGQQQGRRWGSPRLRLVTRNQEEEDNVAHWQAARPGPVRGRRAGPGRAPSR